MLNKARERPAATAAAAAGAVAAGAFLWSKRAQIGEMAGQIGDQIGEWAERATREFETVGGDAELSGTATTEAEGNSAGTTRRYKSSSEALGDANPGRA